MTKHDEIRQILHDMGFKFDDGRTALEMTDEEVEKFVVHFISVMAEFGRQLQTAIQVTIVAINHAIEPYREDIGRAIAMMEQHK